VRSSCTVNLRFSGIFLLSVVFCDVQLAVDAVDFGSAVWAFLVFDVVF
jgi:hypothetical protein